MVHFSLLSGSNAVSCSLTSPSMPLILVLLKTQSWFYVVYGSFHVSFSFFISNFQYSIANANFRQIVLTKGKTSNTYLLATLFNSISSSFFFLFTLLNVFDAFPLCKIIETKPLALKQYNSFSICFFLFY